MELVRATHSSVACSLAGNRRKIVDTLERHPNFLPPARVERPIFFFESHIWAASLVFAEDPELGLVANYFFSS